MELGFEESQNTYESGSQNARAWTEQWVSRWMYCPNCGNPKLNQFPPNLPVADFFCPNCNDQFELKSQKRKFGKKLANGAYATKIKRLESNTSPNLMLLSYDLATASVRNMVLVPKRFFTPSVVEKRKPLAPTAKRAGWIGSNILLELVPQSGRVTCIKDGIQIPKENVVSDWQKTAFLDSKDPLSKGWLIEVMKCVESLGVDEFSLEDVYHFESALSETFPENSNVKPKIRQQLQVLRDNGYLKFLGRGRYLLTG